MHVNIGRTPDSEMEQIYWLKMRFFFSFFTKNEKVLTSKKGRENAILALGIYISISSIASTFPERTYL